MFEIEMFNSRDYLHNEKIIKEVQVTTLYKQMVLFFKSIGTRRRTHQAIMHTVKKAREEEDMDFREALDYAKVSYPKKNPNRR